jgi:erythromycin esterase
MNRVVSRAGVLLLQLALGCIPGAQRAPESTPAFVHPLTLEGPHRAADFAFLKAAVGGRSVVQLGESIHVTDEFPRMRLSVLRYLHEEMGFDVLAFEGSLVDAWLAEEHLARSADPLATRAARAQEIAWFPLWQTAAMGEVMRYVASTRDTAHPLYLSSFDIQVGSGRAYGEDALTPLFEALSAYGVSRDAKTTQRWSQDLLPFFRCFPSAEDQPRGQVREEAGARVAIGEISAWINEISPKIAQRSPVHARALAQVPDVLEDALALCRMASAGPDPITSYQQERDRLNAGNVLALRDTVSKGHRIMVWAHHSHVHHNGLGKGTPSMGQHLRAAIPADLYTIGLFAGEGTALDINEAALIPAAPRALRVPQAGDVEDLLAGLCGGIAFVELTNAAAADARWNAPAPARQELRHVVETLPAQDFHAAIFLPRVQAAELSFLSPLVRHGLHAYGYARDHLAAIAVGVVLLLMAAAVRVMRWLKRRKGADR